MEYLEPNEAKNRCGLRLVLTTGVPGPWSEAAKAVFHVRGVDYLPVRQTATEENHDLVAWTGFRNAPQAIYNDEPARIRWEEILLLAERLGRGPSLIPDAPRERALMFGLSHEICSEDGLGWNRRHQLLAPMLSLPDAAKNPSLEGSRRLGSSYGWSPEATAKANERVCSILHLFSEQLADQKRTGREYLVGDRLSAADLYWATFAAVLRPLPAEQNPMPDFLRTAYGALSDPIAAALDEALIAHRDFIYERHLLLPLDF